jgi:ornithine cyclodeaminase
MQMLNKAQVEACIDLGQAAGAIEDAYRAASRGEVELPPVGHITFPAVNADCHIKYGHRRGDGFFVIKVASGFPENTDAPVNNGVSLVISALTGQVQAVLHDEGLMTDVRTGLGGAIATRSLARPDATRLLVVGTGVQAGYQIEAHQALLGQELEIEVWGRSAERAELVAERYAGVQVAAELGSACARANIIVTTTAAREPVIQASWVQPGTHITAVGADAPGKHELAPALLAAAGCLVADSRSQCLDHGEFSVLDAAATVIELGELLDGSPGRTSDDQITVADLTGIAAQDIAIASVVLGSPHVPS